MLQNGGDTSSGSFDFEPRYFARLSAQDDSSIYTDSSYFHPSKGHQLLPYIHIGPLEIPTFGLLMVVAFATAYYALDGEIKRRKLAFTEADRALERRASAAS